MKTMRYIKNILPCSMLLLASHTTFATESHDLLCPSAEQIHHYQYGISVPYGFDHATHGVKFIAGTSESGDPDAPWLLFLYPVQVQASENAHDIVNATIRQLDPVFTTPLQFELDEDSISYCIYTIPGQQDIVGMAYFLENQNRWDEMGDDDALIAAKSVQQSKWSHIAKKLLLK